MAEVPSTWLAAHAHKLVDMDDLILIQYCIERQKKMDTFVLTKATIVDVIGPRGRNKLKKRQQRLVRDGLLIRDDTAHLVNHQISPRYRLADID